MIRCVFILLCLMVSNQVLGKKPVGALWYNLPKEIIEDEEPKQKGIPFNQLSYTERDAVLRYYTMEALHKARQTKSVKDMRTFLALQDYWLKESSRFKRLFQKTLMLYPEYDYSVTHPTSSMGTKLLDALREKNQKKILEKLSKTKGLLFFYRGKNSFDQKQIPIIRDFTKRFGFSLIPVAVDGQGSDLLPDSRMDGGQADALGVRFFPALLLVDPKTKTSLPVSFGFTTQDVLQERLALVATEFKEEVL